MNMARANSEARFSQEVVHFFRERLREADLDSIQVKERVKILKDFTVGLDRENQWRLIAGFQQQDIVFFDPQQNMALDRFKSEIMRIDKYDRTGQKPIHVPLLICELKLGSSVNTHALITYSSISAQLKGIFPHCAYYFVMDTNEERGMKPETVLRHAKGFDRVFLNWYAEKDQVWAAVRAHLEYLSSLGLLPPSQEHR
jgi:hypothetical protein